MNRRKGKSSVRLRMDAAFLFILPGLMGFLVFYILPFGISLGYSFFDKPVNGSFVGFKNFAELLNNKSYLKGLKNTFIFIGMSVPLNMALSLGAAMLVNRIQKNRELFVLIFLIPLVIPSGSMVFFWKSFFDYNGFLNGMLHSLFGIGRIHWLDTALARVVITIVFVWKNMGYNMVLFISGLHSIPKEYYEAARVDGAGKVREFISITCVNLAPVFFLVLIMSVINSFKVFKEVYLITGGYPHDSIYLLQHFMNNMFSSLNYPRLTTATTILVLITTLFTQVFFRLERKVEL